MQRMGLRKNRSSAGQAGFTLIEALIALLVFTIGILATVSMQISSLQGNSIARHNTDAGAIASSVVEGLKPLPYDHPDLAETPDGECRDLPANGQHTICYTVQDDVIIANTKLIRVTVSWADAATPRNITLDYLIHDTI